LEEIDEENKDDALEEKEFSKVVQTNIGYVEHNFIHEAM